MNRFAACLALLASAALAQTPVPDAFPPDAVPIAGEALRSQFAGRIFHVRRPDGNHWRLQYQASGHYFVNTERGAALDGTWTVEDDRLCTQRRFEPRHCNPVRSAGGQLLLQRANGEVITLLPR